MPRVVSQEFGTDVSAIKGDNDQYIRSELVAPAGSTLTRIVGQVGCHFRSEIQDGHFRFIKAVLYLSSSVLPDISDATVTANADIIKWVGILPTGSGGWFVQDVTNWNPAGFWHSSSMIEVDVRGQAVAGSGADVRVHMQDFASVFGGSGVWWGFFHLRGFFLLPA